MIKQLYKRLNPFEIFLILSLLLVLLITLLIYIDKKSSEKLNFYVFKTQEKSILRLVTAMEEELANLNLLLNKIEQDETNISKITDKLIIIRDNKTILKNQRRLLFAIDLISLMK